MDPDFINALYIVAFTLFIVGLRMLRGPRTAVTGNYVAAGGMFIAVVATLLAGRHRGLGADRARPRDRDGRRDPERARGEDDGDAADGGAVQRRRRRRRGPHLVGRVPRGGRRHRARAPHPDALRRDHRLDLLLGLDRRVRQASGAHEGAAEDPAARQRGPARHRGRARGRDLHRRGGGVGCSSASCWPRACSACWPCCPSAGPTCPWSSRPSTRSPA